MAKVKLSEFNTYLNEQVGQPYIWGAQHLKLTESDYIAIITRKESDPTYRASAIAYCKKLFDSGATVLYAYDCSGLGMYYLQNVKKVYSHDLSANGMMGQCDIVDEPKRGYWLFRVNSDGKATHIGYMVSDTDLIEARGRAYGVVRRRYVKRDWHKVGKPKCVEWDEPKPTTHEYVKVRGGSVRVREGNGTMFPSIGTAHRDDLLPCYGQADADPYWYEVDFKGKRGYISCNKRYTEIVNRI
jgi:hypothetical protein